MDSTAAEILIPLILIFSPLMIFAIHVVLARIDRRSRQVTAIKAAFCGLIPTAVLLWVFSFRFLAPEKSIAVASSYCLLVYGLLAMTYFHFFNMSETARRIRLLYEIDKASSLSEAEILCLYNTKEVFELRFQRLVAMKQLKRSGDFYAIDGKILYLAAVCVSAWAHLLGFRGRFASR